ncbi:MAG: hypothetical protein ACYS0G_12805 [Planctomycetota bacterium]
MAVAEIITMIAGFGIPVVAAPFAIYGLRYLFAVFFREGAELFGSINLPDAYAFTVGSIMAKLNVPVLLLAWIALFACDCFQWSSVLSGAITIGGILVGLLITTYVVRINLPVHGWVLTRIGLLSYAGGNLPLLMVIAGLLLFL